LHLVIHGRVQGVGFREALRRQAGLLQISGWVRNRREGTVEAVIRGEREAMDQLLEWAHHGPGMARVTRVEVTPSEDDVTDFQVRPIL
jgi:acylphosphatase